MDKSINEKLRLMRIENKLTQQEFSDILGITQSYLSALEVGKREISLSLIMTIKDKFGIPIETFLYEDISKCDISKTKAEKAGDIGKEVRYTMNRIEQGDFKDDLEKMNHERGVFTDRIIRINKLSSIKDTIEDIEANMFFCDCIMKEYDVDFLIHEKYALWHKKLISKQELLDKYEEISKILKEFHEVVSPYKNLLEDFSNKLMAFDRNHNKAYCWEEE